MPRPRANRSKIGAISILVNDAGINRRNAFTGDADTVAKDWRDIMAVNLNGVFNVTTPSLPAARQQGPRRQHRLDPVVHARAHAELGRLHHLEARRARLHPRARRRARRDGVRVNAIGPGFIETPLNEKVRATNPELVKVFLDHTPLGRARQAGGHRRAGAVSASDLSAYVTGTIVIRTTRDRGTAPICTADARPTGNSCNLPKNTRGGTS